MKRNIEFCKNVIFSDLVALFVCVCLIYFISDGTENVTKLFYAIGLSFISFLCGFLNGIETVRKIINVVIGEQEELKNILEKKINNISIWYN